MQRLICLWRMDVRYGNQIRRCRWCRVAMLLALALLLGNCGRAEQTVEHSTPVQMSPESATPTSTTLLPAGPDEAMAVQPMPGETLLDPSMMPAYPLTSAIIDPDASNTTNTAEAQLALTPEPTIVPAANGPRLRDVWPVMAQQSAPPTRLYLRRYDINFDTPDTFWEVSLPDGQLRHLPAVEQNSIDQSAQVSPDGRLLAYVTGVEMERTLRVLDLTQGTDRGLALTVADGAPRCHSAFAWSPDSRFLAVVTAVKNGSDLVAQLQIYKIGTSLTPQILQELPYFLDMVGWVDADHLLLWHWQPSVRPAQLLSVDRQGKTRVITELRPERLYCSGLSPDRQYLFYTPSKYVKRLHLDTGEQETIPLTPKEVWLSKPLYLPVSPREMFWIGDGRAVLISRQNTQRRVWLRSLDQIQDQPGIFLSPPYQESYSFGVIGISPDGHTLVACEQPPSNNPRVRVYETRTWLYNIPDDRWTLLSTKPSVVCDIVVGWAGGTQ
ncbi:MAG: hypothetical protein OHK0022_54090 [Roseiflexaceae bacterium]